MPAPVIINTIDAPLDVVLAHAAAVMAGRSKARARIRQEVSPTILSSCGTLAECVKEIDNYDKGSKLIQRVPGRFSPTRLVIPYEANQEGYREFLCLPDTFDPRWPKGGAR